MKPIAFHAPTTVDRLATADEIRAAALPSSDPTKKGATEMFHEFPSDTGGYVRISAVVFETAMIVGELNNEENK